MAEAETLCDRIAIIIQEKLAVLGTPAQITAAGDRRTTITVATVHQSIAKQRPQLAKSEFLSVRDGHIRYLTHDPAAAITALLSLIADQNDELSDLRVERPSLEQRFLELAGNNNSVTS